jgi:hypothetical protein
MCGKGAAARCETACELSLVDDFSFSYQLKPFVCNLIVFSEYFVLNNGLSI